MDRDVGQALSVPQQRAQVEGGAGRAYPAAMSPALIDSLVDLRVDSFIDSFISGPTFRFTPVHHVFSSVALRLHGCARIVETGRLSV